MSLPNAVIDALVASGCTTEQLAAAMKAANGDTEASAARKREADAVRKRRQRANVTVSHADNAGHGGTPQDEVSPKKETSPAPLKEKTTPSQSETYVSSKTPRQALESVLDKQRAADVIEMRQRIRKPLTTRAAELLAGQLAQWHDPNEAADAMVLNAWQGFKPEYLENQRARGSPRIRPERADPFKDLTKELSDGQIGSSGSDGSNWDDAQGVPLLAVDYHRG